MNSIIIQTKIDILKYGVNFKPYDMFTNYKNIEKYKTKKIKIKPIRKDNEVYDMSTDSNILPSEIIISNNNYSSIVKLRYSSTSPLEIKIINNKFYLYKNDIKLEIDIKLVKAYEILNENTPFILNNEYTKIKDYVDIVGIDRISILFFEGCYNWTCGKACKFCDLHPKEIKDKVVKPTINNLKHYNNNVEKWWKESKKDYFKGIQYSISKIVNNIDFPHKHLFFMAGNLPTIKDVWDIAEETITDMSSYLNLEEFDNYLNIAPHDNIERLKRIKKLGIKQVQYNLEIGNMDLFEEICPGKMKYKKFIEKLKEAVGIFGFGNVRSNFVFGLQDKEDLLEEINSLASYGIVADYSVFQPKRNTPFQDKSAPSFDDVIDFSKKLIKIYKKYNFKPIFCSLSSRSSIINELYDKYK